jgi:CDP-4-dehydro-6-deoxyglucose reductase, E1
MINKQLMLNYKKDIENINNKTKAILEKYNFGKPQIFVKGKTTIPLISPSYGADEIIESIDSLVSSWVTSGKKVDLFEKKFADYIGVKYAVMVNSGSSANLLALNVLSNPLIDKISKHSEIITPAVTWATTVYPMINIGAKPIFVDVDPETYTINHNSIEDAISKKTSCIMPVHLLGNSCNMKKINNISKKYNLSLIEDACEAHGAEFSGKKVGSFGDFSTFSFFLSHHITTIEGGMVLTNNKKLYELAKSMRAFGWIRDLPNKKQISGKYPLIDQRFLFTNMGFNLRPTEIQGAFGIHQIKKLETFVKIRRSNAKYWDKKFAHLKDIFYLPKETPNSKHSYFCYPLTICDGINFSRQDMVNFLKKKKIETRPIMAGNMTEQPSMNLFNHKISGNLKNSQRIMKSGFFFGNHQKIGLEEREYIADCILEFVNLYTK